MTWRKFELKLRPNDRNIVGRNKFCAFGRRVAMCCDMSVGCCWLKFENGLIWANNTQHVATRRNTVAKRT